MTGRGARLRLGATIAALLFETSAATQAQRPPLPRPQVRPEASLPAPAPIFRAPPSRFMYRGLTIQGGAVIGTAPTGATLLTFDGLPVPLAADGRFLIAFDRDASPNATLIATLGDGRTVTETLTIARRAWKIERLTTLPRFAQPTEEFNRLRPPELAQIAAARAIDGGSQGWRQPLLWPVIGRLSGLFGSQRIYKNGEAGAYHSGADIAQPTGTPVIAPADGVVILAADHPFTLEGNLLMIDHGMGLNSAFLHLSRIDVKVGERVSRGQRIGAVGMTGRATGPHLHWSLRWRDSRIDPLLLAGPMPVG